MKTCLPILLTLCLVLEAVHQIKCAKRIDVNQRMTEGLAKRNIGRRQTHDEHLTEKHRSIKPVDVFAAKKRAHKVTFGEKPKNERRDVSEQKEKIKQIEDTLGLKGGEHLDKVDEIPTSAGTKKEKLTETYKGLPVVGEGVVVEVDKDGQSTGEIEGNLVEGIAEDVPSIDPILDLSQALEIAVSQEGDKMSEVLFKPENGELVIYTAKRKGDDVQAFLAWKLNYLVEADERLSRPFYVIEATTGTILERYQGITMALWRTRRKALMAKARDFHRTKREVSFLATGVGGNTKTGIRYYGKGTPSLDVSMRNGTCYLENTKVKVVHMNSSMNGETLEQEAYSFECGTGSIDLANEAFSPVNDAFFYANAVYDMYRNEFGIDPLKGKIVARIHFGENFENAFWDGRVITFGDGEDRFYPLVTMDIMAHELGHGFTEHHSGLIYAGQSGALNEAFSDMAGETAKALMLGHNDWGIGHDATKEKDTALRYMDEPSRDNVSIGNANDYCPGINVHHSSGVFNKAFYHLTITDGWDIWTAFDVFLTANRMYWTRSTGYVSGACGVKQAAIDWGYNVDDVINAFKQVGVVPCDPVASGSSSMYDLFAEDNETMTFTVNVPPGLDYVSVETSVDSMYEMAMPYEENVPYVNKLELKVSTEGYEEKSAGNSSRACITVENPKPGDYVVELKANPSFSAVTVLAVVPPMTLADNLTFNGLYNLTFEIKEDMPADLVVSVRFVYPSVLPSMSGKLRYEEPVDMYEYEYDYSTVDIGTTEDGMKTEHVLLCKPKSGVYYMTLDSEGHNATDVSVYLTNVLQMQRVHGD